jgi:hypothetical protein
MEDADVLSYTVSDKNALCQMRCRGNSRQEVLRRVRKPAQSLRCSKCGADSAPDAKFALTAVRRWERLVPRQRNRIIRRFE